MAQAIEPELGVPVWEHAGIICTGETYKDYREIDVCQGRLARGP